MYLDMILRIQSAKNDYKLLIKINLLDITTEYNVWTLGINQLKFKLEDNRENLDMDWI